MGKCKRRICTTCGGNFEMTRGCHLEKRCHPCRFLGESVVLLDVCLTVSVPDNVAKRSLLLCEKNTDICKSDISFNESQVLSMLSPISMSDINESENFYMDEYMLERADVRVLIDGILSCLNTREAQVTRLRFGLMDDDSERTLVEIGRELGVSPARVRQISAEALKKMRHPKVGGKLKAYLD